MQVFIPKERRAGETRVAATPETAARLVKLGLRVAVESGAGAAAYFDDEQYARAGAEVVHDARALWSQADVVLKVAAPTRLDDGGDEADLLKPGAVLAGFLAPHRHLGMVRRLASRRVTSLAMELVPRISRAQPMDALSSQASIAGYKAVLLSASRLGKYFPLLMTAAGTIPPARVVVLGAGVAGLQAIATARRLGAVVQAADIRPAVREEVESLGGKFLELPAPVQGLASGEYAGEVGPEVLQRQQAVLQKAVADADVVIAAALVPGRPSPRLVTAAMVQAMRPGSVIVDLAVEQGGNCELSEPGQEVVRHSVLILGHPNLPATMPHDASTLYARNLLELVRQLMRDGRLVIDRTDPVIRDTLLTHEGQVTHAPTANLLEGEGK